jgi:hypothetical protein
MKQNVITKMSFRELLALKDCLDMLNGKYINEMRSYPTCYDKESSENAISILSTKQSKITNTLSEVIAEIERRVLE